MALARFDARSEPALDPDRTGGFRPISTLPSLRQSASQAQDTVVLNNRRVSNEGVGQIPSFRLMLAMTLNLRILRWGC
jgi:hypothetical protein